MDTGVIYYIVNLANGWVYVGSTLDERQRLARHMRHLKKNKHVNRYLQRDYNEFGEENFEIQIVHRGVPDADLHVYEASEIAVLQEETGRVYNISRTPRISAESRRELRERKNQWSQTHYSPARTKSGRLPLSSSSGSIGPMTSQ